MRQLFELEEMALFEREHMANMMAPVAKQVATLAEIARDMAHRAE